MADGPRGGGRGGRVGPSAGLTRRLSPSRGPVEVDTRSRTMGWRPGPPSLEVEIEDVGDLDGFAFERRGLEPRSRSPGAEKLSEAWIGVAPVARQHHAILETPDRENAAFQRDKARM